jgi:hypothetical protein
MERQTSQRSNSISRKRKLNGSKFKMNKPSTVRMQPEMVLSPNTPRHHIDSDSNQQTIDHAFAPISG